MDYHLAQLIDTLKQIRYNGFKIRNKRKEGVKMPEAETIKYPVADCIKIVVKKMIDPITTVSEWHFLNNLLTGDYGRK